MITRQHLDYAADPGGYWCRSNVRFGLTGCDGWLEHACTCNDRLHLMTALLWFVCQVEHVHGTGGACAWNTPLLRGCTSARMR